MTLVLTIEPYLNDRGESDVSSDTRNLQVFADEIGMMALVELSEFVEDTKCTIALK